MIDKASVVVKSIPGDDAEAERIVVELHIGWLRISRQYKAGLGLWDSLHTQGDLSFDALLHTLNKFGVDL